MNRKIDDLGRIVIPMELRKIFDIDQRDSLEIFKEIQYIFNLLKHFSILLIFQISKILKMKDKKEKMSQNDSILFDEEQNVRF